MQASPPPPPQLLQDVEESSVQMITFTLGEEVYGVDIMTVREIRVWSWKNNIKQNPRRHYRRRGYR